MEDQKVKEGVVVLVRVLPKGRKLHRVQVDGQEDHGQRDERHGVLCRVADAADGEEGGGERDSGREKTGTARREADLCSALATLRAAEVLRSRVRPSLWNGGRNGMGVCVGVCVEV